MRFTELLTVLEKSMQSIPKDEKIIFDEIKEEFKRQANVSQIHMTALIIASVELINENSSRK